LPAMGTEVGSGDEPSLTAGSLQVSALEQALLAAWGRFLSQAGSVAGLPFSSPAGKVPGGAPGYVLASHLCQQLSKTEEKKSLSLKKHPSVPRRDAESFPAPVQQQGQGL